METHESTWRESLVYGVAWFISSLFAILDFLGLRDLLKAILMRVGQGIDEKGARMQYGDTVQSIDQAFLFIGGCVAVSLAIVFEYYFRRGMAKGQLFPRVARVIGIEVGLYLLFYVLVLIIARI